MRAIDKKYKAKLKKRKEAKRKKEKTLKKREQLAQEKKRKKVSDERLRDTILEMCTAAGPDKSVSPNDVARELLPDEWQSLLKRTKRTAAQLAKAGHIEILRKGKPVDPEEFKGIIKLRIVAGGETAHADDDQAI